MNQSRTIDFRNRPFACCVYACSFYKNFSKSKKKAFTKYAKK